LTSAHADSSLPLPRSSDLAGYFVEACSMLKAETPSKSLLAKLGATEINNFKGGWYGHLDHWRFTSIIAWGPYDDDAVPSLLLFYSPRHRLKKQDVEKVGARVAPDCFVRGPRPGVWGRTNTDEEVLVATHRLGADL
jgi:hypothetical protein